jgi:hypothetical protein
VRGERERACCEYEIVVKLLSKGSIEDHSCFQWSKLCICAITIFRN